MKSFGILIICVISIAYVVLRFLISFLKQLYVKIFVSKSMTAEYEANNLVKKSVIFSTISCQLEIDTKVPSYYGNDEFFNAVIKGNLKEAKNILASGYNINTIDNKGATALMYAVTFNKKHVIEFLIEADININAQDNLGRSALHYALLAQKTENIQYLLDRGANINIIDINKNNLIIYALYMSNDYAHPINDIIDVLLTNDIKLTSLDNIGISEVNYAIRQKVGADIIMKMYKYEYGDKVTFTFKTNKLLVFLNGFKILKINFSHITEEMSVSDFIEFNIKGKKQVITCNCIEKDKISDSLIGIYDCYGTIFSGFGVNRKERFIFELEKEKLPVLSAMIDADEKMEKDLEQIRCSAKKEKIKQTKTMKYYFGYTFNYYLLAFSNFFNFEGKATRPEFWFFNMYNLIIDIVLLVFFYMGILNPYIISIYCMFVFIPKSAIMIRRLRDAGFNVYISIPYILVNLILMSTGFPTNSELYLIFRSFYWVYFIILIMLLCFPSRNKERERTSRKIKDIIMKSSIKYYIIAIITVFLLLLNYARNSTDSFKSPESSFISGAQYNPKTRELYVNIHNNRGRMQYKYYDVDTKTFNNFKNAESKGKFFNQNVKNDYNYQRTK
jgi:uncharacterized membrane protein YhaH (DUF805 family)